MRRLKIFVSSPGDVIAERQGTRNVIGALNEEMMGNVFLVPVLWEQEPLLASETFQTQIESPANADILVGVLWSRIGSPLPEHMSRADETRYESGTAFELESALSAHKAHGKPDILLYLKLGAPTVSLDDRQELMERLEQTDRLDGYIKENLMTADGSYLAAFHTFDTEEQFADLLKTHLRKLILKQLEHAEATHDGDESKAEGDVQTFSVNPDALSVAVLAFDNMSYDAEQHPFVDGLEEIITELSYFQDLDVIARHSSFRYKGQSIDVREVGRQLGAHYVLQGSVRRSGDLLRVTTQLLDAGEGNHLWAETFDRKLAEANIFEVQGELSKRIATAIWDLWGGLGKIRQGHVVQTDREILNADQSVAYGNACFGTLSIDQHSRARRIIEDALTRYLTNSNVWAQAANLYSAEIWFSHNPLPNSLDRALTAAQRAVERDSRSDRAYTSLALVNGLRNDYRACRVTAERVLKLAPNSGFRLAVMGMVFCWMADRERGVTLLEEGMGSMLGSASASVPRLLRVCSFVEHYRNERFEDALEPVNMMDMPKFWGTHMFAFASSAALRPDAEAAAAKARLLETWPDFLTRGRAAIENLVREKDVAAQIIPELGRAGLALSGQSGVEPQA